MLIFVYIERISYPETISSKFLLSFTPKFKVRHFARDSQKWPRREGRQCVKHKTVDYM